MSAQSRGRDRGDTKITVVVVVVAFKEEEALLTREDLLKTPILIVIFVGEMATTRTSVGVNAKSVEIQITLKEIVGIEKTMRRKMPTSPKRKETRYSMLKFSTI
ncbi:hypothetical protein Salat_2543300 [Sesamum alatum]|uniref:Uncharacterized protein n=1 Tax=Sesamum alatum TaxID=300844 RepID=A0AAE1XT75_9LAMI|nr:hypothetical protein Salat_2543300 [Sesamum alatum]